MIEAIILCAIFGVFILISFVIGVQIGQKTKKDELVEIKNPIKVIKEYKENKEIQKVKAYEDLIEEINLHNIENYDGTGLGQRSFPDRNE